MTGKGKKINFWTTKEIREKISRARTSKTSLEDEVRVEASRLPKLSRSCHSTEKTNGAKELEEGAEPAEPGQKCQHMWKFPVNRGTESSSWSTRLYSGLRKTQPSHGHPVAKTGFLTNKPANTRWRHCSEKRRMAGFRKATPKQSLPHFGILCIPRK